MTGDSSQMTVGKAVQLAREYSLQSARGRQFAREGSLQLAVGKAVQLAICKAPSSTA